MSEQGTADAGATPAPSNEGGATPPATPGAGSATLPAHPPTEPEREAPSTDENEDPREAGLGEEGRRLLREARKAAKDAERELKSLREEKKTREDAEKTELERATEERDTLRSERDALLRAKQATEVAIEFGVPEWADELATNEDTRTMRAHAQRIRDRLGRTSPGMDGGVRGLGLPPSPQSMDDMIRQGARR